jgi:hypothetical protein
MPPDPSQASVNLVRPDGSVMTATREQADKLALLGYKLEGAESAAARLGEEGREQYYSTTGQKLKTAGEGLLRGATLGGSDYLIGDDDTAARQQYNPGIALGSEIVGGVAPMFLTGGTGTVAQVAARTPTALAARGAAAVGKATGLGKYGAAAFNVAIKPTSAALGSGNPVFYGAAVLESYNPIDGGVGDAIMVKASFKCAGNLYRATA